MRFPLLFISAFLVSNISIAETPWVAQNSDGSLVYRQDQLGNKIPDFSHVGYHSGIVPLPTPGVVYTVEHTDADATQILQSAIDHVSKLKPNKAGQQNQTKPDNVARYSSKKAHTAFRVHFTLQQAA